MSWRKFHSHFQPMQEYWLAWREARLVNSISRESGKQIKRRAPDYNSSARNGHEHANTGAHLQPKSHPSQIHVRQTPPKHLLDMELPVGIAARPRGNGEPLLHDDRGPHRTLAGLRDTGVERRAIPSGDCRYAGAFSPLHTQLPANRR